MLFCCGLVRKAQGSAVRHASSPSLAFLAGAAAAEPFSGKWTTGRSERESAHSEHEGCGALHSPLRRGLLLSRCPVQAVAATHPHPDIPAGAAAALAGFFFFSGFTRSASVLGPSSAATYRQHGKTRQEHGAARCLQAAAAELAAATAAQPCSSSGAAAAVQQQPRQQAPCSNTYSLNVTHRQPLTTHTCASSSALSAPTSAHLMAPPLPRILPSRMFRLQWYLRMGKCSK